MSTRHTDGSAGDVNYGKVGVGYKNHRQPEPRIEALIWTALGKAQSVLNVGAGSGSYEPTDREVTALEPSESMRLQRPRHLPPAIDGTAEKLPFENDQFDASMSTFSIHQWSNFKAGLTEMRRVTRGPVLILTCDPAKVQDFWLNDYAPKVLATEARRFPPLDQIVASMSGKTEIMAVPIPLLCRDGFNEAYYGRPEKFLDPDALRACSAWSFVDESVRTTALQRLSSDLASGRWDAKHSQLRSLQEFAGSLRLIIARRS